MRKGFVKATTIALSAMLFCSSMRLQAEASNLSSVLPEGGINIMFAQDDAALEVLQLDKESEATPQKEWEREESFEDIVISVANDYVNIRSNPSQDGEVLGKLYKDAAGTILSKQDDWYEIQSGNVTGFVKAEFCATGAEAEELAKQLGTRMARVQVDGLLVRSEADSEGAVLGMVVLNDELAVTEETDEWVKVDIEEGFGWVSREFITVYTEFSLYAESKEEEAARLQKEAEERRRIRQQNEQAEKATQAAIPAFVPTEGSENGISVVEYAVQFVGNPYVWGGSSLTNGADCSGFTMKVYENFGVSLPHSSSAQRKQGYAVEGLENAQPGDLICYSGHVAIYMGDGMIVHASNKKDGIKISKATYRKILAIRRIF
ncbi:MAG: C40 family peptidase [Lachnospiraceae bacterium]|nr:C40 family peptidase [Lachnospiraceae bacterium]